MIIMSLLYIGLLFCIIASAYFSGSEMAYSCANRLRLENLKESGDHRAGRALYIIEHFDDALGAILIGNNLVNIAASSIGSVLIIMITGSDSFTWVSTLVLTIVIIIFGEAIPKITSKKNATGRSMTYSAVLKSLMIILYPFIKLTVVLVSLISKLLKTEEEETPAEESVDELHTIIETAEDEGIIDSDDSQIVQAAIDFSDISASEAMTARVDMEAIDIEDDYESILSFIQNTSYSRIPVYRDSIDNIIGILHLNRFFRAITESDENKIADIESLLMPPCHVYKTMKLPKVLSILKEAKQHLAVVTDEYSGTLGVISMEDVLEQIVGEIWDETDIIEDEVVENKNGDFEIDGDLPIGDFLELAEINEEDVEIESETVGGWTIETLGSYPAVGDRFEFRDMEITVLEIEELRVLKVLVRRKKQPTV